jgi:hypothetical protein
VVNGLVSTTWGRVAAALVGLGWVGFAKRVEGGSGWESDCLAMFEAFAVWLTVRDGLVLPIPSVLRRIPSAFGYATRCDEP